MLMFRLLDILQNLAVEQLISIPQNYRLFHYLIQIKYFGYYINIEMPMIYGIIKYVV